jgi:hypothetical protein
LFENRYFNSNSKLYDYKSLPILIIGYIFLLVCGIINIFLYILNIHNNDNLLVIFSTFPILLSWIYHFIKIILNNPDGDLEYLSKNYPEIYKYLRYKNMIFTNPFRNFSTQIKFLPVWKDFKNGFLTKDGEDEIIDEMIERWRKEYNLLNIIPILYSIIYVIALMIVMTNMM